MFLHFLQTCVHNQTHLITNQLKTNISLGQTETCRGPRFKCFLQQCQEVPSPQCGQYCLRTGIWDPAKPAQVTNSPNSEFLLVAHPGIPAAHRPGLQQQQLSREGIHCLGPKWTHDPHGISSFWASPCKHRSFISEPGVKPQAQTGIWDSSEQETLTCWQDYRKSWDKTCQGQAYSENNLPGKVWLCSLTGNKSEDILTKPLTWFLSTPCSSWGCRNMAQQRMDRWTQSMPGYLWGPHCYFLLIFYPLGCREE